MPRIPFFIMAAAVAAVSCARLQEGGPELPGIPVSWQVVQTRAASPYPEDETFISHAWYRLPEGGEGDGGGSEAKIYIDGAEISHHSDGWHAGSPFFWPPEGTLSFFSYAPADMPLAEDNGGSGVRVTQDGVHLDNWNVLDDSGRPRNVDFLVADPVMDITAADAAGGVPTLFRHTMTRIRVNIHDDQTDDSQIEIKGITLNYIYCTGSYASGLWGSTSTHSNLRNVSLTLPASTIGSGLITDYVIMLPQNLLAVSDNENGDNRPAPSLTIEYNNPASPGDKETTVEFADWPGSSYWTAGHDITYTITFGKGDIPIDFDAGVDPWTGSGGITVSGQ